MYESVPNMDYNNESNEKKEYLVDFLEFCFNFD